MAIVFIDGFDHYSTGQIGQKWDSVVSGGGVVGTSYGRYGSKGVQIADTRSITKTVSPASKFVVGVAFNVVDAIDTNGRILVAFLSSGALQCEVRIDTTMLLTVCRSGTVLGTAANPIQAGVNYFLEFMVAFSGNTASGDVVVRLGGVPVITSPSGWNVMGAGGGATNQVQLGHGGRGLFATSYLVNFDDLYILDGGGSRNNGLIGDQRVEVLMPAANGSLNQWTSNGAGSQYQCVNETSPDGDTTYISSAVAGQQQTFTYPSTTTVPVSVAGVQTVFFARKDDAGTRVGQGIVKVGGVVYAGNSFGIADAYSINRSLFEVNPATGSPWTPTEINAMEAGVKLVT